VLKICDSTPACFGSGVRIRVRVRVRVKG